MNGWWGSRGGGWIAGPVLAVLGIYGAIVVLPELIESIGGIIWWVFGK